MKLHYTPTEVKQKSVGSLSLLATYLCEDYLQLWDEVERLQGEIEQLQGHVVAAVESIAKRAAQAAGGD